MRGQVKGAGNTMDQNPLFSPYQLGRLMLPNRMLMAPMTRGRANPDLVWRFQEGASFNDPDFVTLFTPGLQGYTDYPTLRS
jgi:2,4-dienoyl-CoA reductase-like NADH-dependent reductase (Old Yellow Enzyme family)